MISSFNLATLFDFVTYGAETKIMQNLLRELVRFIILIDELLELLEFQIPLKWRNQMHLQNFEVQEHTIKEFT